MNKVTKILGKTYQRCKRSRAKIGDMNKQSDKQLEIKTRRYGRYMEK